MRAYTAVYRGIREANLGERGMKAIVHVLVVFLVAVPWAGCATLTPRQPTMTNARVTPDVLKPGDVAVITVEVSDRYDTVARVEGIVEEDRQVTLNLKDDGVAPDAEAEDGIWTLEVDVPRQAPPGDFHLVLTGYDADGGVVLVRNKQGDTAPLSAACLVVIQFAAEE